MLRRLRALFLVEAALSVAQMATALEAPAKGPDGFTSTTQVAVSLRSPTIMGRYLWTAANGESMKGTIMIAGAVAATEEGGKVLLYGDRVDPLLTGETDWQMAPRPDYCYFSPSEFSKDFAFPFGPGCARPDGLATWKQYYNYTACLFRENNTSTSHTATLTVINLAGYDG